MGKKYAIHLNGTELVKIVEAINEKSALAAYRKMILSSGEYALMARDDRFKLVSSYGAYWTARVAE